MVGILLVQMGKGSGKGDAEALSLRAKEREYWRTGRRGEADIDISASSLDSSMARATENGSYQLVSMNKNIDELVRDPERVRDN